MSKSKSFKEVNRFIHKYHFKTYMKDLVGKKLLKEYWNRIYKMESKEYLKVFLDSYLSKKPKN